MNDIVIRAKDLKKVYRLYSKPSYRFLDMFGLLGDKPGTYTEHSALDGLNLEIRRGEKVAIIGRNGAGKSTFLKLVTGVIQPTSGVLEVQGQIHALLQIGTGFHPEFTGRENVYAYLAQLGVTGAEAEKQCAEAIEFAELEEYIDQPVKTYSTGMGVRLMFATSTVISPELLVLDEVLGVGDAYFAQKSFDRMQELCARHGTTLLLVTHDVYSAVRLCERIIWIDRGRILHDADGPTVVGLYEDSIRLQEEHRLRLKARQRAKELADATMAPDTSEIVVEIQALHNVPQPSPVYFSRIELLVDGVSRGRLPLEGEVREKGNASLQLDGTSWGDPVSFEGRHARALRNFGSPFHKVAGVITVDDAPDALADASLAVEADFWSESPCELTVRCFVRGQEKALGLLPASSGAWITGAADGRQLGPVLAAGSGRQGSGAIVVHRIRPIDDAGRDTFTFIHGQPFSLEFAYRINRPGLKERAQVLVAFHRDGVQDVMRSISRDLLFDEAIGREGVVAVRFPKLYLANGSYSVTLMLAKEGYYDETQSVYFSLNPGVYTCLTRALEIVVEGGGVVATGTAVVADADWNLTPAESMRTEGERRRLNFPEVIAREFPQEFPVAWNATEQVLAEVNGADLSRLAEHSPGLRGYDWTGYLKCSVIRLSRALRAMRRAGVTGGLVLDCGSYFGNASLMCASAGYRVDAIDSYKAYSPAFDGSVQVMKTSGIRVIDFDEGGLEKIAANSYDAVLCLGVIEHLPHTPRPFLESIDRILKPGGVLVIDTPNIAYLYSRLKLARGESIMPALAAQFGVTPPFEGHHREYTTGELRWMLEAIGHQDIEVETFNYSVYALQELNREEILNLARMDADPDLRELMLSVSRKPTAMDVPR
jgi:lipopolysaccharide transport system ATP-binding protein